MSALVWRFYIGNDRRWRWQTLTPGRSVVCESEKSCPAIEACISAAEARGYLFETAQASAPRHGGALRSAPKDGGAAKR
jgi:hypothetical protein